MTGFAKSRPATAQRPRKKGSKKIEMINDKRIQPTDHRGPFCTPKPVQICACAWIYRWTKKLWKLWTGPPGLRAAGAGLLLAKPFDGSIYTPYGERNFTSSLLLRKSQNLPFLAHEVQWASKFNVFV